MEEARSGYGGWVEIQGLGLPGRAYVRITPDSSGRRRVTEFYVDGQGEPIQAASLTRVNLGDIEAWLSPQPGEDELWELSESIPGPDLATLAAHYASSYGPTRSGPGYHGRNCGECGAPLRGDELWRQQHAKRQGQEFREQAITDWVELSWLAQTQSVPQPKPAGRLAKERRMEAPEVFELVAPSETSSDGFLADVARAYNSAVARGLAPATELQRQLTASTGAEFSKRTIEGWVYRARKRGILAPATSRGRIH